MRTVTARRVSASGLALAMSAVGLSALPPAQAASPVTSFSCTTPLGNKDMTSQSDTDFPEVMYVGDAPVTGTYTGTVTAPADLMGLAYDFYGARTAEGYSDQTITVTGVTEGATRKFRVTAPKTPIVKGQPLVTKAVGDFGTITPPSTPGVITITAGSTYVSHMVLRKADGSVAQESDSTCTSKSGSGGVVDTIRVMARSTTKLVLADGTAAEGGSVEVSAEVTVTGGTPTGSVKFSAGDSTVTVPVSGGKAEGLLPDLVAGTHQVTAQFIPTDAQLYEPSTSEPAALTVASAANAVPTKTTLQVAPTSAEVGSPVTLSATVTADKGTPEGNVRFQAGGKTYTAALANGAASTTASDLPVGSHNVTATFVPTKPVDFKSSSAESRPLTITPKAAGPGTPTVTTLAAFPGPITYGHGVAVTAYVAAGNGVQPEGIVRFTVAGIVRDVPVSNGQATASLPKLPVGEHEVTTAFIPANETFAPSSGETRTLTVVAPPAVATTLALSAPTRARVGTAIPVRASLSHPTATGTVQFAVGSVTRSVEVSNGVAAATLTGVPVGARTVTANFTPANPGAFRGSSASRVVRVVKATTRTAVSLSRVSAATLVARGRVSSTGGRPCRTKATVRLVRSGRVLGKKVVPVACNGTLRVAFKSTKGHPRGLYTVAVQYAGSAALAGSSRTVSKRL